MRIGIVSTLENGAWGGCEPLWVEAAQSAMAEGDDVAVCLSLGPETARRTSELKAKGAELFWRKNRSGILWRQYRKILAAFLNSRMVFVRRLGEWLTRRSSELRPFFAWSPDVVIVSQGHVNDCCGILHTELGPGRRPVPYVTVTHLATDFEMQTDEVRNTTRLFLLGAKRALFVATNTQGMVERQLACALPNAEVIRNPVNIDDCSVMSLPESDTALFAYVGRLHCQHKGIDLLFEALSTREWQSREWRITLYGDGPDRGYLQDLAVYYGIEKRVVFAGYTTDIRGVWEKEQMLVMPSRIESAPLVLVEAMLCGRPSVVTDVGGITEWVGEPDTAFVAEATTVCSIRNTMERAWQARSSWQAMGMAAHEVAESRIDDSPGRTLIELVKGCVS